MTRTHVTVLGVLLLLAPATATAQPPDLGDAAIGPVRVETLELEPTVVKTGDLILQRYRVRFPDLIDEGQEILILEDRMAPETLPVHPFEGVSLSIDKARVDDEHIWVFTYGFRLVDPSKMTYLLPNFSFYYLVRDLGEDIEDAEVQQVDGGQGLVRYVTTITDEPILAIRDTIELGSFAGRSTFFRALVWTVAPLPMVVWLVMLLRLARTPTPVFAREGRRGGGAGADRGADPDSTLDLGSQTQRAPAAEDAGGYATERQRADAGGCPAGSGALVPRLPAGPAAGSVHG